MNDEERESFHRLAADVVILKSITKILCQRFLTEDEIERLTAPLDPYIAGQNPETARIMNERLASFKQEIMMPLIRDC